MCTEFSLSKNNYSKLLKMIYFLLYLISFIINWLLGLCVIKCALGRVINLMNI